jgi:hypothetical protein
VRASNRRRRFARAGQRTTQLVHAPQWLPLARSRKRRVVWGHAEGDAECMRGGVYKGNIIQARITVGLQRIACGLSGVEEMLGDDTFVTTVDGDATSDSVVRFAVFESAKITGEYHLLYEGPASLQSPEAAAEGDDEVPPHMLASLTDMNVLLRRGCFYFVAVRWPAEWKNVCVWREGVARGGDESSGGVVHDDAISLITGVLSMQPVVATTSGDDTGGHDDARGDATRGEPPSSVVSSFPPSSSTLALPTTTPTPHPPQQRTARRQRFAHRLRNVTVNGQAYHMAVWLEPPRSDLQAEGLEEEEELDASSTVTSLKLRRQPSQRDLDTAVPAANDIVRLPSLVKSSDIVDGGTVLMESVHNNRSDDATAVLPKSMRDAYRNVHHGASAEAWARMQRDVRRFGHILSVQRSMRQSSSLGIATTPSTELGGNTRPRDSAASSTARAGRGGDGDGGGGGGGKPQPPPPHPHVPRLNLKGLRARRRRNRMRSQKQSHAHTSSRNLTKRASYDPEFGGVRSARQQRQSARGGEKETQQHHTTYNPVLVKQRARTLRELRRPRQHMFALAGPAAASEPAAHMQQRVSSARTSSGRSPVAAGSMSVRDKHERAHRQSDMSRRERLVQRALRHRMAEYEALADEFGDRQTAVQDLLSMHAPGKDPHYLWAKQRADFYESRRVLVERLEQRLDARDHDRARVMRDKRNALDRLLADDVAVLSDSIVDSTAVVATGQTADSRSEASSSVGAASTASSVRGGPAPRHATFRRHHHPEQQQQQHHHHQQQQHQQKQRQQRRRRAGRDRSGRRRMVNPQQKLMLMRRGAERQRTSRLNRKQKQPSYQWFEAMVNGILEDTTRRTSRPESSLLYAIKKVLLSMEGPFTPDLFYRVLGTVPAENYHDPDVQKIIDNVRRHLEIPVQEHVEWLKRNDLYVPWDIFNESSVQLDQALAEISSPLVLTPAHSRHALELIQSK